MHSRYLECVLSDSIQILKQFKYDSLLDSSIEEYLIVSQGIGFQSYISSHQPQVSLTRLMFLSNQSVAHKRML